MEKVEIQFSLDAPQTNMKNATGQCSISKFAPHRHHWIRFTIRASGRTFATVTQNMFFAWSISPTVILPGTFLNITCLKNPKKCPSSQDINHISHNLAEFPFSDRTVSGESVDEF